MEHLDTLLAGEGGWAPGLILGGLFALSLELLLLVLRRVRRRRIGLLEHAWALFWGAYALLVQLSTPHSLARDLALGAAVLLTAHVLYSILDELLLQRPWDREGGSAMPKLAIDVLRAGLLIAVALGVANKVFGVELTTIVVSSTVLSAVIGFALQDVLKNVFAGMALQVEHPFEIGHWLSIDDSPAQVIEMTWRTTRLRTNEGVILVEPNSEMAARRVVSYGTGDPPVAMPFRVGLGYDVPPAKVKEALLEAARTAPGALAQPAAQAFVEEYGDHAIGYHLRVWTKQVRSLIVFRDSVQTRIWYALQRRGLVVPFPIRTLHFHDMEKAGQRSSAEDHERVTSLLSGLDLFRDLAPETLQQLAAAARRQHYSEGEQLVSEGDAGDSLFLLEEGSVVVRKSDPGSGDQVTVARLPGGAFFGEASLLTGEPRSATVVAERACSVLILDRARVAPVMAEDPNMAWSLSRALAARVAEAEARVEDHRKSLGPEVAEISEANILKKIRRFFKLS